MKKTNKPTNTNPIKPFWSWNDKLEKGKLVSQIDSMRQVGIGGFFMHARGGLITEYMSEEWFSDIEACLDKAKETGLEAWAYDENGWPSGFANGIVPQMGEDYQQKRLLITKYGKEELPPRIIAYYKQTDNKFTRIEEPENDCIVIGYDINIYYVDTFNPEAIKAFIENTHQKYYERFSERFGKDLKGFFTDEPQYGGGFRIPWSQVMPTLFKEKYGYNILDIFPYLFFDIGDFAPYRADFYNFVSMQFKDSFIKQMYDWCSAHNCKLTGHVMNEHDLGAQMASTAGAMSCYEYFHEPGIDWLGRKISSPLTPKQLGSVAAQLGKKTLTETFALCGWDVSLNELKWIAQWQMVNGVTSLCPHLEGYSMKGCRKRDYPASLFTQLPWFKDGYPILSNYFTNLGQLLDSGKEDAPILVVHALQSVYTSYNPNDTTELSKRIESFEKTVQSLNDNHIPHHYGDEIIMTNHGLVNGNELVVGKYAYKVVFLPELTNIALNTLNLLKEFAGNSGKIVYTGEFPKKVDGRNNDALEILKLKCIKIDCVAEIRNTFSDLISISVLKEEKQNPNIHLMHRYLDDGRELLYLVNLVNNDENCVVKINGKYTVYDYDVIDSSEKQAETLTCGNETVIKTDFAPYGSFVYILDKSIKDICNTDKTETVKIQLDSSFNIERCDDNALTLDYCEYRVDGGEWQQPCPIIVLQKRLINLERNCNIEMRFSFKIDKMNFSKLNLCIEAPELYSFEINGKPFEFKDNGEFVDHSIRRCSIKDYVALGDNYITVKGQFYQNENVYRVLFTPGIHEVEKNKLTYDTELESIYITGDFGILTEETYHYGERRCIHAGHTYTITSMPKTVNIENITESGFWFFSGKISLQQKFTVAKQNNIKYNISLTKLNAPAARLIINGKYAGTFAFAPYVFDVTNYIQDGENEILIELLSGNRNLLGPHHKPYGESYSVGPSTFTDVPGWSDAPGTVPWTDNYSFVLFGAEI